MAYTMLALCQVVKIWKMLKLQDRMDIVGLDIDRGICRLDLRAVMDNDGWFCPLQIERCLHLSNRHAVLLHERSLCAF